MPKSYPIEKQRFACLSSQEVTNSGQVCSPAPCVDTEQQISSLGAQGSGIQTRVWTHAPNCRSRSHSARIGRSAIPCMVVVAELPLRFMLPRPASPIAASTMNLLGSVVSRRSGRDTQQPKVPDDGFSPSIAHHARLAGGAVGRPSGLARETASRGVVPVLLACRHKLALDTGGRKVLEFLMDMKGPKGVSGLTG